MIEQHQRKLLSNKAKKVLGDKVLGMTTHGAQVINHHLESALQRHHGIALAVTDDEIMECFKMIEPVCFPKNDWFKI